ncbi:MAG: U32 family peptidase, partial [Muribaculaceae bacterium]|nr:U32 family peptidase [Muribaculaceae bacterium]
PRTVELLAPARDAETAFQALLHGADAVYMGPPSHGARRQAANSIDDIRRVADFAHGYGARLYVTVNTLVYEDEIPQVEALVWELYRAGVDALIVQDLGLLRMNLPPIALHASTQCDTRGPGKARFLQDAGFSQIVLARELSLDEIRAVADATDVPLEVFVHGALCVSYSGDCQASYMLTGRSANRGECAQVCRFPFDLEDASGRKILTNKHLLSLRDMNRSAQLAELLDAGATSFKIEGRLKDAAYVKNVVAAYRRALDEIIDANPGRYRRSSLGRVRLGFIPRLDKSFNRGYTSYFLTSPKSPGKMATFGSPKWIGEEVGKVLSGNGRRFNARLKPGITLNNGDGLGYYDAAGTFCGFRLNRAENGTLFTAAPVEIPSGSVLYRNADAARQKQMAGETAERRIALKAVLRLAGSRLALDLEDEGGLRVSEAVDFEPQEAKTPQAEARLRVLTKLGDTRYSLAAEDITDEIGNIFVPASGLTALRRDAV